MPPKTRRAGAGPTAAGQSTLSFKNRISKPTDSVTALKNVKSKLSEPAQEIITEEIAKQSTPEPEEQVKPSSGKAKADQAESPVRIVPSPARKRKIRRSINDEEEDITFEVAEKQAQKISDAQVKRYWKAEEDSRIAPRGKPYAHYHILLFFVLTSVKSTKKTCTSTKRSSATSIYARNMVLASVSQDYTDGKERKV